MTRPNQALLVVSIAEDGLDPTDGLTPEEALARIVYLIRREATSVAPGYDIDDILLETDREDLVGPRPIQALLEWCHEEDREARRNKRAVLEDAGLLAPWA